MDAFKLAFETTIVGLLSFVWLALAVDILFPTFFLEAYTKVDAKYQSALGVAALTLAYVFGSAIMPVAGQLMNDEHWPLPEFAIRCWVTVQEVWRLGQVGEYPHEFTRLDGYKPMKDFISDGDFKNCRCSYVDVLVDPVDPDKDPVWPWPGFHDRLNKVDGDEDRRKRLLALFSVYENRILADLSDPKNDSLRQLHERIVVLRGAVINGALLFLLCLFGTLARRDNDDKKDQDKKDGKGEKNQNDGLEKLRKKIVDLIRPRTATGLVLAVLLTGLAIYCGSQDIKNPDIFDMPVLESLFGLATIFGGIFVYKGVRPRSFLNHRTVWVSLFLTLLAYGGWLWSEVLYDTAQKAVH